MLIKLENIEEYESAVVYIDDIVYFTLLDLSKDIVIKKNIWKKIREDPCEFFEENFYQENLEDRITIKSNVYEILRLNFTIYGITEMCDLFLKIEKSIYKQEYLEEITENEEEMDLKKAYKLLDINRSDNINSNELTKIYRKKSLYLSSR